MVQFSYETYDKTIETRKDNYINKMKLIFCVSFAFFCIQGSMAAKLNPSHPSVLSSGLLESLRTIIDELIIRAEALIAEILGQVNKIVTDIVKKLEQLLVDSQLIVDKYAEEVKNQIDQFGSDITPCLEEQRDALEKVIGDATAKVKECIDNALEEIGNIRDTIVQYEDSIKNEIAKLKSLLAECDKGNPLETIGCVIDNINKVNEILTSIGNDAKIAIETAVIQFASSVSNARSCIASTITDLRSELANIALEITKCLQEQQQ